MKKEKWLDGNFKETEKYRDVCYIIRKGEVELCEVELCTPYDTVYPIITVEEILKLAEILKEEANR